MLTAVEEDKVSSIKLLSYVYDRMGSSEATSLTFYIGSNEGTGRKDPEVFGWDYVDYGNKDGCNLERKRKAFINYKIDTPADYFRLPYTLLIDTVIGLKQFAGEVIKSPISFLEEEMLNITNLMALRLRLRTGGMGLPHSHTGTGWMVIRGWWQLLKTC